MWKTEIVLPGFFHGNKNHNSLFRHNISPFYSNFSNLMFPRSYVVSFSILSKGNSNKHAKHIEKKKS